MATHVIPWLFSLLTAGCGSPEPVLTGIPSDPILVESGEDTLTKPRQEEPKIYEKPADVWVDAHHIGGRTLRDIRPILSDQLGALRETEDLEKGRGREMVFERGTIRTLDDRVYMIRVPLPRPIRRTDALQQLGFPPFVGKYISVHREYRLNHEWDFRRIRMIRLDNDSEFVTEVECWRWVPGEHSSRR